MSELSNQGVDSQTVAAFLGRTHHGPVRHIKRPTSVQHAQSSALVFLTSQRPQFLSQLAPIEDIVVITDVPAASLPLATIISSPSPRLDFARALGQFFSEERQVGVHPTALIDSTAALGLRVSIGAHAVIEAEVTLGDDVVIGENVVLRRRCVIGERTIIKANSVIGEAGFGFEYDENGLPVRVPHLGAVSIGSDVEIGALVTIARGTLDDTVIGDHVKLDDHVFIAHNVSIGTAAFVIAGAEISGSVRVGAGAWIGPQVTIREQVTVGERAMVGIGAVVISDVPPAVIAVGNPARVLRPRDNT